MWVRTAVSNTRTKRCCCSSSRYITTPPRPQPMLRPAVEVKSSLLSSSSGVSCRHGSSTLIPYHKSWAWQNWLLHQRLQSKRRRETCNLPITTKKTTTITSITTNSSEVLDDHHQHHQHHHHHPDDWFTQDRRDRDVILLLEHDHVYTLGRGADENHLTFLQDQGGHQQTNDDECAVERQRHRLARTNRGPGSARLSVDWAMLQSLNIAEASFHDKENSNSNNPGHYCPEKKIAQAVQTLSDWALQSFCPVMAPNGVPIYRVERGGEVTYHGPGQLVVYPLLDLKQQGLPQLKNDLHWFVHAMEQVIIQTCAQLGIPNAHRDDVNTGVWVGPDKVAAVGVAASRWITTHGFAINVDPNLTYFDTSLILPCGIEGKGVTSIGKLLRERQQQQPLVSIPTIHEVASIVLKQMENVLRIELETPTPLEPDSESLLMQNSNIL